MKIGIIDSGFGGEHISSLLRDKYKCETVQWTPILFRSYSDMDMDELVHQCNLHLDFLLNQNVDLIIVGCMTLSTNLSKYIKAKAHTEVVDLYEGLPEFDEHTLVISTTNTANSGKFNKYIRLACPNLSSSIQSGYTSLVPGLLRGYELMVKMVLPFNKVILGCSHYSGCKEVFKDYYKDVQIIDPVDYLMDKIDEGINNSSLYRVKISS